MKIVPVYKIKKLVGDFVRDCFLCHFGRKAMCVQFGKLLVFPAGTPRAKRYGSVVVYCYRGEVNHFHTRIDGSLVESGRDPHGLLIADSKRLGAGRKAIRKFLAEYPPVDACTQAFQLRQMVRAGD